MLIGLIFVLPQNAVLASTLDGRLPVGTDQERLREEINRLTPSRYPSLIHVDQSRNWVISLDPLDNSDTLFTYIAEPNGKTYRVSPIDCHEGFRYDSAFISKGNLVLPGHIRGNSPSPGVAVFVRKNEKWVQSQFQDVMFESDNQVEFAAKGSKLVAIVYGTTYPKHMSVSHSNANLQKRRTFEISDGKLLPTFDEDVSCPMGVVDDMLDHKHLDQKIDFRKFCTNSRIAKKAELVLPELWDTGWRCDYEKVAKTHASLWATKPRLRIDFVERNGNWLIRSIVHVTNS